MLYCFLQCFGILRSTSSLMESVSLVVCSCSSLEPQSFSAKAWLLRDSGVSVLYFVSLVCVVLFNLYLFEAFFLSSVSVCLVSIFFGVQLHDVYFHVCFADTALPVVVTS